MIAFTVQVNSPQQINEYLTELKNKSFVCEWILEIRADNMILPETSFQINFPEKCIFTCRTEDPVLGLKRYRWAIAQGICFIDVDYSLYEKFTEMEKKLLPSQKLILSWHDYSTIPQQSERIISELLSYESKWIKLAYTPCSPEDLIVLHRIAHQLKNKGIVVGMGETGRMTRILYKLFYSPWCYIPLKTKTAPGQISYSDFCIHHSWEISENYLLSGLIGGSQCVGSHGPVVYNRLLQNKKVKGVYFSMPFENLRGFPEFFSYFNFSGISVTMPHKLEVTSFCSEISSAGTKVGCVNTLVKKPYGIFGDNTDYTGVEVLLKNLGVKSGNTLLMGVGGAARPFGAYLKEKKITYFLWNRSENNFNEFSKEFSGDRVNNVEEFLEKNQDILVIINTTPMGKGNTGFFSIKVLKNRIILDLQSGKDYPEWIEEFRKTDGIVRDGKEFWKIQGKAQIVQFYPGILDAEEELIFL